MLGVRLPLADDNICRHTCVFRSKQDPARQRFCALPGEDRATAASAVSIMKVNVSCK